VKRLIAVMMPVCLVACMLLSVTGCPETKKTTTDTKKVEEKKTDTGTTKTTEEKKTEETKKKDS